MKRRIYCLLLAMCLLLTACAKQQPSQQTGEEDLPENILPADTEKQPKKEQQLTAAAAEQESEEKKEQQEQQEQQQEQPQETPPPKYAPLATVSADSERVVRAAQYGLSSGMEAVLLALQDRYYQALGGLSVLECDDLFATSAEASRHEAIWRSLIEIRKASLIDLHLTSYSFTLYCTGMHWNGEEEVRITLLEDAVMYFAATSYVPSEQFDVAHTFTLARTGQDSWLIKSHSSDDNPYDNFSYDRTNQCDTRLQSFLSAIASRQAQRGGGSVGKTAQHAYDRSAAYAYMQTYASYRNGAWYAYDSSGGNCQNFTSQVLHAGGIPMDEEGDACWYWKSHSNQNYSWINVTRFMNYAQSNTGYGLVADASANYYDGQTGDVLIMGDGDMEHATVIADTITGGDGGTVDYLICSNTSNYRNFPASAYYYTSHWLVRIIGWNDVEPEEPVPPADGTDDPTPPVGGEEETPPVDDGETTPPADGEEPPVDGEETTSA